MGRKRIKELLVVPLLHLFFLLFVSSVSSSSSQDAPHVCVWHDQKHYFDLSPLTVDVGLGYVASSTDGGMPYYFNFCAPTALSVGCMPTAAVCQAGVADIVSCGQVSEVSFDNIEDGVKVVYGGGTDCGGTPRSTTINVHCDKNATSLRVGNAKEVRRCEYEIDVYSLYGCAQSLNIIPPLTVNIFLVVHSHDDVGWLKTYEEYYSQKVQHIIENIVTSLTKNATRKFIQVEQAFFSLWWDVKRLDAKWNDTVVKLVQNNQLSFAIGGWVMPDEATTSYTALITQLTEGHQYLKRHFNFTPDVSWQIDPFGASSSMAEIYSEAGFKGHVIDRINFSEKNVLQAKKSLQFYWNFSKDKSILTHILDSNYCYPWKSGLKAASKLEDGDIADYARLIVDTARLKARSLLTPNVMLPVGCDFSYADAAETEFQYEALDKAINYINNNKEELNVGSIQYSNVSDYFTALHNSSATFPSPSNKVDFFPYNDANNSWWTGYYTTAPNLKGLIRRSEATLRASELLYSTTLIFGHNNTRSHLDSLTHAISVNLHHDAITGTSNLDVVNNYNGLLNNALPDNNAFISATLSLISTEWKDKSAFDASLDPSKVTPVVVYNSLPWIRHDYVKLSLKSYDPALSYFVSFNKSAIKSQVLTSSTEKSEAQLFFKVELPPLGYSTYFVSSKPAKDPTPQAILNHTISNNQLKVTFTYANTIDNVTFNGVTVPFHQDFMLYESYVEPSNLGSEHNQESGPYVFRSNGEPYLVNNLSALTTLSDGQLISDVYQVFECGDSATSFVKQHVRIFHDDDEFLGSFVELSQAVGPLPKLGAATNVSFTDSNGLRFVRREYDSSLFLPIPGNYYPTVYASYIQHENSSIGFIFDRAHGLSNGLGRTDVMLHRRISKNDGKGINKLVDDDSVAEPVIRLVFGTPKDVLKLIYKHIYLLNFPPVVAIGKPIEDASSYKSATSFSLLSKELPANVHLLDLKSANTSNPNEFILRLAHLFDSHEHETLSLDAELTMHDFFMAPYCISKLTETQLTAITAKRSISMAGKTVSIVLKPKQIRTFIIEVKTEEDVCKNNTCGHGKCVKLGCSYLCLCDPSFSWDDNSQKCIPDSLPVTFFHQFPLAVISYLSLVCGYSIRSELRRMNRTAMGGQKRKNEEKGDRGRVRRFMQANKRMLERTFFPTALSRHQD